jgi:hydrogenase nickel incorporation protein HypA/HybF
VHEMGIASSVLDTVRDQARRCPGSHPSRVGLRIGEWCGVDVESLRFCFEALTRDSDLSGLQVEIDYRERRNRCNACGQEFAVNTDQFRCPACSCEQSQAVSGAELDIAYVELED